MAWTGHSVRELKVDDREAWSRLWSAYLNFYEAPLSKRVTEMTWQRLVDARSRLACGLVAEASDGRIVGLAHWLEQISTWSIQPVFHLQDLYVDQPVRGNGIGRDLLQSVILKAERAGSPKVQWLTRYDNERARALYDQLGEATGFVQYHRNFI